MNGVETKGMLIVLPLLLPFVVKYPSVLDHRDLQEVLKVFLQKQREDPRHTHSKKEKDER